jgi:outer membrane protein
MESRPEALPKPSAGGRILLAVLLCPALAFAASCMLLDDPASDADSGLATISPRHKAAEPPAPPTSAAAAGQNAATAEPAAGPLSVGVEDAILLALENNRELSVERLNPAIEKTHEGEQAAAFDPLLSAGTSWSREEVAASGTGGTSPAITEGGGANVGIDQLLPAGTSVGVSATTDRTSSSATGASAATRLGLTLTQPVLRGFGSDVNLAALRQSRLDTRISQYELRGFAEALVARVEETYWDYALATAQIAIFENSLKLAEQQLQETEERILIGKLGEIERAAAQAEVAQRREGLINARANLATKRLQLLRLLNLPGGDTYRREVTIREKPQVELVDLGDVAEHIRVATQMRPELNQGRLAIRRDELEVVRTRNGLLPRLDLFLTLGKSGYASSFAGSAEDLDGHSYDLLVGATFEQPIGNRAAQARHRRATLNRRQAEAALANLEQLVELDVRSANIAVEQAREQVAATAATRAFREQALQAETEKFRVGTSTTFLVGQAQRDFVASQIVEVQAAVAYRKALVEFYRLEGSLLVRRGITAPGEGPPDGPSPFRTTDAPAGTATPNPQGPPAPP